MIKFKAGKLVLATGREFHGVIPEYQDEVRLGEIVFNTGMTGYEETLTDPSYAGQILNFTFPILGNYGVSTGKRWESEKIHALGVICETVFEDYSHYSGTKSFLTWLKENNIPIICGVDTRELTKELREHGSISGVIAPVEAQELPAFKDMMNVDWVAKVSPTDVVTMGTGKYKVILVDCGAKENIVRYLLNFDITLKRVPFDYDYSNEDYDGVMLSNGPGDPKLCLKTIEVLSKAFANNKPIFGICLGSQMMALAAKAETYKLKFGHRGHNQPCMDMATGLSYLTSQNHSYAVDENTLSDEWRVSFRHLNDNTVAGIEHKILPYFAVQFHPEACSGPQDTSFLFDKFYNYIVEGASK